MYPALHSINWTRVRSWDDLENSIISLPTEQARGEMFEEFCQAFLTLQKDFYQAQQVWRFSEVPSQILEKLGCSTHQDQGIDGILLHHDGTITAYQAKFRTSRADIPSQRELSTFYMVSDRADYRLIISNVEDLPRAAKARKDHGQVLIEELLDLDESFFKQLQEFIFIGHLPKAPPPIPKPYQVQAIIAITEGLSSHSRGQAILACGAGKTFIGKWVVDRLHCRRILVMVPSLALVRQTLGEWHRAETQDFRYICICSDESVDALAESDEWVVQRSDLDVRVSTSAIDLIQYLQRKESVPQVVFSTYQSSAVLVKALADPRLKEFQFDLVICDEAHRLAGVAGRMFNQVLNDDLIRAKKRLFMTATPKIIAPRSGPQQDEEQPVELSMDSAQTFGPVLYFFGFAQAIKEEIISDYRIVVIGVAEEEIALIVRSGGTVQTEDEETWQAENLAQRIALGKAITTYGIKKVFTFHNRVQAAARFIDAKLSDGFPRIMKRMSPGLDFSAQHISGVMSAGCRAKILREFRMSPRGVVTNARCLGEGVNVPIVDGVFFANPRKSVIDIVQATGRALRRIPGKAMAYIIIPVLVRKDENAEQILEDSRFQTVWKVLSAMASQDDRLEVVIRETRIKQGEGVLPVLGKDSEFAPGELPDTKTILMGFPTHIPFSKYQSLFTLEMMEKLGERWELRFGSLRKYMERYGKEPTHKAEFEGFKIGEWLNTQKKKMMRDQLPPGRAKLLEALGIHPTDPMREHWGRNYAAYKNYVTSAGKQPDNSTVHADVRIGVWLDYLRKTKKFLSKEQIQNLDALGISWERHPSRQIENQNQQANKHTLLETDHLNPADERWELFYALCRKFLLLPGENRTLTPTTVYKNRIIGAWFYDQTNVDLNWRLSLDKRQRISFLKQISEQRTHGTLPESNSGAAREALDKTGESWIRCYMLCKEFLSLPDDQRKLERGIIYKNEPIGAWFKLQVGAYHEQQLSPENGARIAILLHLSEERTRKVNRSGERWTRCYLLCKEFLSLPEDKGRLKRGTIYKNEAIGGWFDLQVGAYNRHQLSQENRVLIEGLLLLSEERTRKINRKNQL